MDTFSLLIHINITTFQDYGNEVRGCHAVRAIVEEEILVEVPLRCLITVEMGKETQVQRRKPAELIRGDKRIALTKFTVQCSVLYMMITNNFSFIYFIQLISRLAEQYWILALSWTHQNTYS